MFGAVRRNWLAIWSVIIGVVILWGGWTIQRQTHRATKAATALCLLRHDLKDRVASAEQFLKNHPQGLAGIPAATIKSSVDGQRRTVKALSILKCP